MGLSWKEQPKEKQRQAVLKDCNGKQPAWKCYRRWAAWWFILRKFHPVSPGKLKFYLRFIFPDHCGYCQERCRCPEKQRPYRPFRDMSCEVPVVASTHFCFEVPFKSYYRLRGVPTWVMLRCAGLQLIFNNSSRSVKCPQCSAQR